MLNGDESAATKFASPIDMNLSVIERVSLVRSTADRNAKQLIILLCERLNSMRSFAAFIVDERYKPGPG